jgi:long-chain acyl-CoA synthetase
MITHGNIVASMSTMVASEGKLYNTDIHLSYLPLPHLYERLIVSTIV